MTDDIRRQQSDQNLDDPFSRHRQQLRQAMENSVESMRRALVDQQKIYAQFNLGLSPYLPPNGARETDPMEPITAEFVGKAYERAREMFGELERKINESHSPSHSPQGAQPTVERRPDDAEDIFAASALMMSSATSHLSAAMKAMVEAMGNRASAPVPGLGKDDAATRLQNPSS